MTQEVAEIIRTPEEIQQRMQNIRQEISARDLGPRYWQSQLQLLAKLQELEWALGKDTKVTDLLT